MGQFNANAFILAITYDVNCITVNEGWEDGTTAVLDLYDSAALMRRDICNFDPRGAQGDNNLIYVFTSLRKLQNYIGWEIKFIFIISISLFSRRKREKKELFEAFEQNRRFS